MYVYIYIYIYIYVYEDPGKALEKCASIKEDAGCLMKKTTVFENPNYHPHPHCRAPCIKHFEGSARPIYLHRPRI